MKNFVILLVCSSIFTACATTDRSRSPSSVTKSQTILGKGARIILRQPVPFINTEDSKQTVKVTSRRSFLYGGDKYFCSLSAQVPRSDTFYFDEGTVFDFKDKNATGTSSVFTPKKGSSLNLSCYNATTGEQKNAITVEEAQTAFPTDVLVIEQLSQREQAPYREINLADKIVGHYKLMSFPKFNF